MSSSFSFPRPTTTTDDLEDLYKVYGVDRVVVLDLAGATETPETVWGGHLIAFLVRAREEGLSFGLGEFRHLVLVKRNKQNPGTFLVSPRPGCHVIEDVPYRDEKWRERFFVFKVDRAYVGHFDFSRLPRNWAENVAPSGSSLMSDQILGLIGVFRRDRLNGSRFDQTRTRAAFAMPEGTNRAPSVIDWFGSSWRSSFRASGSASRSRASDRPSLISIRDSDDEGASEERQSPISLSLGSEDETVAATRDLISLAGRMRSAGCRLPSLASSDEKEAYAKVAVASSKVMEALNEYVVVMEDRVEASQNDKEIESIGSEIKRLSEELKATKREGKRNAEKIEALTDDWKRTRQENEALTTHVIAQKARIAALEVEGGRDIRRASRIARCDIAERYREILQSLKEKWMSKKKEVSGEIHLQEVIANMNELKDGGLTVDAELARLNEMEGDCEGLVASAAVLD
ncbi:hypothetical protein F2Q69_00009202 [Brassica cretica]|uniref:Uncharacterized protein n=1 Tax=Brassica cretica TaxID=69181 RepID=A0A8S9P8D3_BRACR|nr:hypothetical protein F2Q69_00009202 [Brassica cretica]